MKRTGSSAGRRLAKTLSVAASLAAALLVCEAGLRLAGVSYPRFRRADPDRGYALRPHAEGWFREEGESYVRINSDGLRDGEHARAKPPGTLRIAVVGDSFAEAFNVPAEDAFWSVMGRELAKCPGVGGRPVEVINFGVSGYGTAQELITLRRHVWEYAPDVVVLAFFTGNDVRENSRALYQNPYVPYFVYRGDRLVLDDSFRREGRFRLALWWGGLLDRLFDHSRLLQVANQARLNVGKRFGLTAGQDAVFSGLDEALYREPRDEAWADAWRVTEGLVVLMRDEVRARGAQFFVVTLSSQIQDHPDAALRQQYMRRWGSENLFYPDQRIKALGERAGFPVLNLAPAMQAYAEQRRVFLHGVGPQAGTGHWNSEGHRVAGEMIAAALCEQAFGRGLPPAAPGDRAARAVR